MPTRLPIETTDDGLLMRPSGEWAYDKLFYVNAYIGRFIVSMRRKNWRAIHYIDLFAGPGKNKLPDGRIIMGSPLLAMSQKQPFDRYFFVDSAPANIAALRQRCAQIAGSNTCFYIDDANRVVDTIVAEIKAVDRVYRYGIGSSLNLAFLDPEGLQLHWETVAKLAACRTDMIIYYPQMGITREAPQQIQYPSPTQIDCFFGDDGWRNIYQRHKHGSESFLHRALLDYYKQKFVAFGYKVEDPLPEPLFRNTKDAPLYRLLFVSKHPLGNKFWADATKNLPNGQLSLI